MSQAIRVARPAATGAHTAPRLGRLSRVLVPGALGILLLASVAIAACVGPAIWHADPLDQDIQARLRDPSVLHPLGTDQFGRDLLARILAGARWSLSGAAVACLGTSAVGFAVGAAAALSTRKVDALVSRAIEALMAVPTLVTALAFSSLLGPSFRNLLLALVITSWPWYARAYRALLMRERSALYVEAARALGATTPRTVVRHIVPNVLGPAVVLATANFGSVILNLAGLSFLGLGIQPPTPEWGSMINEARPYFQQAAWQLIAPGLCIALTVLAVNLTGDALRDVFDPRVGGGSRR